ncbi:MAG: hypothetical protein U5K37_00860 [Natrialbaceae archaeon]|nr:hypothetical protein [Natrialbaceae archaeon]
MPRKSRLGGGNTQRGTGNLRLSRRSLVQAVAGGIGLSMIGTVRADEYETIRLGTGEDRTITVSDGERFENVLIDSRAQGARVTVVAHGTDWVIRNVGVRGRLDIGEHAAVFGVSDTGGGESVFENVYLGDGSADGGGATSETGVWVSPEHSGHLDFSHVNVQSFPDNGIYGSAPAGNGGGTIHIDQSYAANNYVSGFRIGSEGSKVTNSSVYLDEEGYDGRGIWVWSPGPCEIENCQLELNGRHFSVTAGANGAGTNVSIADSDYDTGYNGGIQESHGSTVSMGESVGTDPEATPCNVPLSAEDAARGVRSEDC